MVNKSVVGYFATYFKFSYDDKNDGNNGSIEMETFKRRRTNSSIIRQKQTEEKQEVFLE